jgi:N-acetylglucosamine kinase-like BadF-type ATPase
MTNERIAGFGRHVLEEAARGDEVSGRIVEEAGRELGQAAAAVVRQLRMERERFQAACVGGVFKAGELVLEPLRETLEQTAPRVFLAPPHHPPAHAAALMARAQLPRLALAG